jgi:ABC-2 type transport system permease protein
MGLIGLVAAGYAIGAALRLRGEETSGRVESVLAASVSRQRWATSHLAFAILGPGSLAWADGMFSDAMSRLPAPSRPPLDSP